MPKKMGLNSKAVEARERKQEIKKIAQEKKAIEIEDAKWKEDLPRNLIKKEKRKEDTERKKADAAKRKMEAKELLEAEQKTLNNPSAKQSIQKITRQQVQEEINKRNKNIEKILNAANKGNLARVVTEEPALEENLNRSMADTIVASNVDEALIALSVNDKEDFHPEKRMRAAYKAFEAVNLPRIKAENPSLRLSQWKQMLMKEWNKSPDNPFNQVH
ncbi:CCDC124 family protein [Megaselia abdita]